MQLWITMVEAIYKKRGEAKQLQIDTWLTSSTPGRNWKDKYKDTTKDPKEIQLEEVGLGGGIQDSG